MIYLTYWGLACPILMVCFMPWVPVHYPMTMALAGPAVQTESSVPTKPPSFSKPERHQHRARSENGRLLYDGEWYCRGQTICIDRKYECPTRYLTANQLLCLMLGGEWGWQVIGQCQGDGSLVCVICIWRWVWLAWQGFVITLVGYSPWAP